MIILATIITSFGLFLGVLAWPYSRALSSVCFGISLVALGWVAWRQREALLGALGGTAVLCLLGFLGWSFLLMPWANREAPPQIEQRNPGGTAGAALIVYHPGRSNLQTEAVTGFADGLAAADWAVTLATANSAAPADLTNYDLLVVGAQSYTWAPAQPVQAYLRRVGDLAGKPVVAILSGLGETGPATTVMADLIAELNGKGLEIYHVWQMRPIDELYGIDDPHAAMYQMAVALAAAWNER